MSGVVDVAEEAVEIREAEVVYMFVEYVEPRTAGADPIKAGHFDIDFASAAVGIAQQAEEIVGVLDVFEHMTQYHTIGLDAGLRGEVLSEDGRIGAFVGRIDAGDRISLLLEFLEE